MTTSNASNDDCSCQYLLKLSSATDQEDLKHRFINFIADAYNNFDCQIDDGFDYIKNKQKQSSNQYQYNTAITNPAGPAYGQLVISSPIAHSFSSDKNLLSAIQLFNDIYHLFNCSNFDALTKLLNRKAFELHINQIYKQNLSAKRRAHDDKQQHCIAMIDIDHFKAINDQYGHLLGDEVLILMSQLMQQTLRDNDLLFRFGGEEFIAILNGVTIKQAGLSLERFRQTIENHDFPQVGKITISIGYCHMDVIQTYNLLLERADSALYYAKEHGRNQSLNYEQLAENNLIETLSGREGDIELF